MRKVLILGFALCLIASHAFGITYYYSAAGFDANPFDENNNYSPINYGGDVGNLPSPGPVGEGGEKFDLEGLQVREDDQYVYVALANSFGYAATSTDWNFVCEMGDIFVNTGTTQYAIDLMDGANFGTEYTTNLVSVDSWVGLPDMPGSFGYSGDSGDETIAGLAGAFQATGTSVGSVSFVKTFAENFETFPDGYVTGGNDGGTYVWEFRLDKSLLGTFTNLDFHVTLGCGNDVINENWTAAGGGGNPIPEPTTMALLGLGLLGSRLLRRKQS